MTTARCRSHCRARPGHAREADAGHQHRDVLGHDVGAHGAGGLRALDQALEAVERVAARLAHLGQLERGAHALVEGAVLDVQRGALPDDVGERRPRVGAPAIAASISPASQRRRSAITAPRRWSLSGKAR